MPIPLPTTPEQFCWLYAVGCLEYRYQEKTLDENDYFRALEYVKDNEYPPDTLVRQWFPKPFENLEEDGLLCTLEEMQEYWWKTHASHKEETPVIHGTITKFVSLACDLQFARIDIENFVTQDREKQTEVGNNLHGYELSIGDKVRVHGTVIAEKV